MVPTMPMSRDDDLEWGVERAVRDFSCFAGERGWGCFDVVGE